MSKDDPDERAARAAAELKQTEQLLAGFDRPARTPRAPPVRDFVEYHQKRERPGPGEAPRRATPRDPKRAAPTVVIPRRKGKGAPSWLLWVALLVGMPALGMLVAYWALARQAPAPESTTVVGTSSASTTSTMSPAAKATTQATSTPPTPSPTSSAVTAQGVHDPSTEPGATAAVQPAGSVEGASPRDPKTPAPSSTARPSPRASSTQSRPTNEDFIKEL